MTELQTLIRFIQKKKPVLWVGAGLSIDAGYPTVGALAEMLWEEHAFDPRPPNQEAYDLVDEFYRQYGEGALDEALSAIIPAVSRRQFLYRIGRMEDFIFPERLISA